MNVINELTNTMTVAQAKDFMRPQLNKGVICPCCGLRAQLYTRNLTSSMIHGLILMYRQFTDISHRPVVQYIHIEDFFKSQNVSSSIRGDIPKLRFWGLIEAKKGGKEDGNPNSGLYRVTDKGMGFVEGKILIQKSVKIYNNQCRGFSGPEIDIWGAIKQKFNYSEVMGGKNESNNI